MAREDDAHARLAAPERGPGEAWYPARYLEEETPTPIRLKRAILAPVPVTGEGILPVDVGDELLEEVECDVDECGDVDDMAVTLVGRSSAVSEAELAPGEPIVALEIPALASLVAEVANAAPSLAPVATRVEPVRSGKTRWLVIGGVAGVLAGIAITASGSIRLDGYRAELPVHAAPPAPAPAPVERAPAAPASTAASAEELSYSVGAQALSASVTSAAPPPALPAVSRDAGRPKPAVKDTPDPEPPAPEAGTEPVSAPAEPSSILDKEL